MEFVSGSEKQSHAAVLNGGSLDAIVMAEINVEGGETISSNEDEGVVDEDQDQDEDTGLSDDVTGEMLVPPHAVGVSISTDDDDDNDAVDDEYEEEEVAVSDVIPSDFFSEYKLASYPERVEILSKHILKSKKCNKNSIAFFSHHGQLKVDVVISLCEEVKKYANNVDFVMITLIRILWGVAHNRVMLSESDKYHVTTIIDEAFSNAPCWPSNSRSQHRMKNVCFWSENHILMLLSTHHLYQQWKRHQGAGITDSSDELEEKLLLLYLKAHAEHGMYEALSHVYLPYSLCAAVNLIDYSEKAEIRAYATRIANHISEQLLLGCNHSGVATFTASARSFPRTRLQAFGHNVNSLISLVSGNAELVDGLGKLGDFLLTSSWIPSAKTHENYLFQGFVRQFPLNPPGVEEVRAQYNDPAVAELDRIPLYWSAGLVTHKSFILETQKFVKKKLHNDNKLLRNLNYPMVQTLLKRNSHFSSGQVYFGMRLNLYKQRGLVLSSFDHYNDRNANFQQLPWMLNLDGVPLWSQAGYGDENIGKWSLLNTHGPCIEQRDNILVAAYTVPSDLRTFVTWFTTDVRFFFPRCPLLDEEDVPAPVEKKSKSWMNILGSKKRVCWNKGVWWCGAKGGSYVGVLCTEETKLHNKESNDAMFSPNKSERVFIPQRVCKALNHSWIVVTGAKAEFADLRAFRARCEKVTYTCGITGNRYNIAVTDQFVPRAPKEICKINIKLR
jgi:hypothetical protein